MSEHIENTSGQGKSAVVPAEIKKWNWGAFLLNWIWARHNEVYYPKIFYFIPVVNIVLVCILGARGSEYAWQNRRWDNIKHFQSVQKKWAWYGIACPLVLISILIATQCF